jgi:hypothetical protein
MKARALLAGVAALSIASAAHAQTDGITLTCRGVLEMMRETTNRPEVGSISLSIVVNLAAQTVEGFHGAKIKITAIRQTKIEFSEFYENDDRIKSIKGTIDRLTGETLVWSTAKGSTGFFDLRCNPAQLMF